jgi:hypothetical protein
MSDISPSSIRTTPELEKLINAATSGAEIQEILHQEAVRQGLVTRDIDPSELLVTQKALDLEAGRFSQPLTRTITVNGTVHTLEGADEAALVRAELELFKQVFANAKTADPTRDERGRFVADGKRDEAAAQREAAEAVRQSDLELKFKRGEITTAQYLADSGAIEQHLASQGIDMDVLRNASVTQSWEAAVIEFKNSPEGSSWEGGPENLKFISDAIKEHNLIDTPDKVGALVAIYRDMKANGQVVPNADLQRQVAESERDKAIRAARTPEELKAAARIGQTAGGTFIGS